MPIASASWRPTTVISVLRSTRTVRSAEVGKRRGHGDNLARPAPVPGRDGPGRRLPDGTVGARPYAGAMRPVTDLERRVAPFKVVSDYQPSGDQPTAIEEITKRVKGGVEDVVLLGATGTGKTATVAWVAEQVQRPMLVMQPNKTLAAQFANELRQLFPDNAVEYFVSYYDYYQPEAYVPQTDTYIEKDSSINEEVERLRHSATNSLLTRRDVIVVSHRLLHLRPRHPAGVRRPDDPAQGRRGARPRLDPAPPRRDPVHPQRHGASPAAPSGSAATPSRSSRSTRSTPSGSSSSATRSSG